MSEKKKNTLNKKFTNIFDIKSIIPSTLAMEAATLSFTLFFGLESVIIPFAASVQKCLTNTSLPIIIICSYIVFARACICRFRANWIVWEIYDSLWPLRNRSRLFPTLPFATFKISETIFVAQTSAVFVSFTSVYMSVIIILRDSSIARTNDDRQFAGIC